MKFLAKKFHAFDTFRAMIENADASPTQTMLDVFAGLDQRLSAAIAQWNNLLKTEAPALTQTNVPLIVISK